MSGQIVFRCNCCRQQRTFAYNVENLNKRAFQLVRQIPHRKDCTGGAVMIEMDPKNE